MGRRNDDRGGRDNGGASEVIAQAIRTIGVIIVVLIAAYVILRITGTVESLIFSSPDSPSPSGGTTGIVGTRLPDPEVVRDVLVETARSNGDCGESRW